MPQTRAKLSKLDANTQPKIEIIKNSAEEIDCIADEQRYIFNGTLYPSYEEYVKAKRKRNAEVLAKSGLLDVAVSLSNGEKKPATTRGIRPTETENKKRKYNKRKQITDTIRRSNRLAGIQSDGIYIEEERSGYFKDRVNDGSDLTVQNAIQLCDSKWRAESLICSSTTPFFHNFIGLSKQSAVTDAGGLNDIASLPPVLPAAMGGFEMRFRKKWNEHYEDLKEYKINLSEHQYDDDVSEGSRDEMDRMDVDNEISEGNEGGREYSYHVSHQQDDVRAYPSSITDNNQLVECLSPGNEDSEVQVLQSSYQEGDVTNEYKVHKKTEDDGTVSKDEADIPINPTTKYSLKKMEKFTINKISEYVEEWEREVVPRLARNKEWWTKKDDPKFRSERKLLFDYLNKNLDRFEPVISSVPYATWTDVANLLRMAAKKEKDSSFNLFDSNNLKDIFNERKKSQTKEARQAKKGSKILL